jgi:hypothetical protein
LRTRRIIGYYKTMFTSYEAAARRPSKCAHFALLWLFACIAMVACGGSKGPRAVKSAAAYRADLFEVTENINGYLLKNTPENTARDELQQAVGEMAHQFTKLSAEAGPLQGKTGDAAYGAVAAQAEDGVIVAGNLASALAADPAKRPDAVPKLAAAMDDWVAYNEELARLATAEVPFEPSRWWDAPPWRELAGGRE